MSLPISPSKIHIALGIMLALNVSIACSPTKSINSSTGGAQVSGHKVLLSDDYPWTIGVGKRIITPVDSVWLAGYGFKRAPDGKLHDLWAKALILKARDGKSVLMITTDHQGMSKALYEALIARIKGRFGFDRSDVLFTFSHNHCGPRVTGDLTDAYPVEAKQEELVAKYSEWMINQTLDAINDATQNHKAAQISVGEGLCTFAVNRRDNVESEVPAMIAEGKPLKGVVDHAVPVLAVRGANNDLYAVLFGYACHPTTLQITKWNGDYPGYAQLNLEAKYPGTTAMFFNACGGDQNPLPRRQIELCEKYGKMLSDAVESVLEKEMTPLSSRLETQSSFIDLAYHNVVSRQELVNVIRENKNEVEVRWAKRILAELDAGKTFSKTYPYPLSAWRIGELLLIGMGAETVVDYSLNFKRKYPGLTWVAGYLGYMVGYIPSHRVWLEGKYEGGPFIYEFGHPAYRWSEDIESRITSSVEKLVDKVSKNP